MPTWKGWNEHDMRQQPSGSKPLASITGSADTVMGFTAINAPSIDEQLTGNNNDQPLPAVQEPSKPSTSSRASNSMISEYLGLGEDAIDAPVTQVLRGVGAPKTSTRGRKRAGAANVATKRKQRKVSDISDGMSVTKPSGKVAKPQAKPMQGADTGLTHAAIRKQSATSISPAEDTYGFPIQPNNKMSRAVPVIAPVTSMDTFQVATQQTSVDALKAGHGRTKTIYRRTQTQDQIENNVSFAEPLLHRPSAAEKKSTTIAPARALRPRNKEVAEPTEHHASSGLQGGVRSSNAGSNNTNRTRTPSAEHRSSSHVSVEDFFDDEDDDETADVLALAQSIEVKAAAAERPTKKAVKKPLPTPVTSDAPAAQVPRKRQRQKQREVTPILTPDEEFVVLDDEEPKINSEGTFRGSDGDEDSAPQQSPAPPSRDKKLNIHEVDENHDYGDALLSDGEKELLLKLKSSSSHNGPRPIVRNSYPKPVLDRSPVFGISATTTLRTCFRIGEALREGCQAVRCNKDVILELYARVTASTREPHPSRKQHFVFKDLYHDKPPHLEGIYELWGQSQLWNMDSSAFLQAGKGAKKNGVMCRVVARMRRIEMKWRLEVLSIWEAGWEDVEVAEAIFAKVYGIPRD